ncbi:hypothetical protein LEP1GSC026_1237 [Leptospira interrogans str. 2002000623]|uniref:Uncharacterized protein n=3 Tax=Leptospira interrogans TaxID=173 RepID=Q8F559_LEPIN|nr:hypothetical protein LA_1826 [Leptospira interrogans serovar Lai str. 56601]ALE40390.1 hypothetical protein G436_3232 [Leptospira interrogans serovar Hardjo str. Norma]EKQ47329.1 hypothetical protein LEP1GSC026_1237 [Leptospira interrogans str. 2002000623]MBE0302075.1 hypothetical protein [Leptospira interrogans serovar Yeoncheon]OOB92832.1 hypothetical protein B0191_19880 [Leptospira interrogans serovar Hardjo]OOB95010.1 hypothetical protein B0192_20545 [Leptospira interrogans serovar Aust
MTNKILNIKSLVNGKKFLDIGLVLFFYFQLERYFEETTFCNSVFYLLPYKFISGRSLFFSFVLNLKRERNLFF